MSWLFWHLGFGLLDHAVWLIPVAFIAAAIFVPGFLGTVLTLSRTWLGGALIGALLGGVLLWELRAGLDHTADMRRQIETAGAQAQIEAAKAALARQDAEAQRAIADRAARRAEAAEAERQDLEEQAADVADRLDAAEKGKPRRFCCSLTADDIAALDRIGAPRAKP